MDWLLVCAAMGCAVAAVAGLWNAYQFSRLASVPEKPGKLPADMKVEVLGPASLVARSRSQSAIRRPRLRFVTGSSSWFSSFWRHVLPHRQRPQNPRS